MKISKIRNVKKFFDFLNECSGNVYITGTDGTRINMKSDLSKYFAVANIFAADDDIQNEFEIEFENPIDLNKCIAFCLGM